MNEGSMGYYNSSSVLTELSAGSSGNILTMGASVPAWGTVSGSSYAQKEDHLTANFSTTSTTFVSTGLELTLRDESGSGIAMIQCSGAVVNGATNVDTIHEIFLDGSLPNNAASGITNNQTAAAERQTVNVNWNCPLSGETVTWQTKVSSSNCTIIGTNPPTASLQIMEAY